MATFRKRGDRWQAMVRKQGIIRTRTFGNKAIAQKWARRVETEIEDGSHGEAIRGGTVAELVAELEALPMAERWSHSKRAQVGRAVAAFGGRPAGALTRSEIDHWFHRSNYAASSKALTLKALQGVLRDGSVILRWATARQAVREAQAGLLAAGHAVPANQRQRRVSEAEIAAVMRHWPDGALAPASVLHALVDTPIRSGELCALRWDDLDGRTILVRQRKSPRQKHDDQVPLLGRTWTYIDAQPRRGSRILPVEQKTLGAHFRAAAREAGLEDVHLHDLRHEGISRLFEADWSIPEVALVSGHTDWNTLRIYTHIDAEGILARRA